MKKNLQKTIGFFTACILVLCALCPLFSYANDYVKWEISKDEQTLTDGNETYTRYYLPLGVFPDAVREYVYENSILGGYTLRSTQPGGPIVWYNSDYVFVTEEGKEILDAYLQENAGIFRVTKTGDGKEGTVSAETIALLDALSGGEGKTVSVRQLQERHVFSLYLYDNSDIFYREYAGIYALGNEMYYLCYDNLPNSCFDADGMFSYRSGEVTLYRMNGTAVSAVENAYANAKYREYDISWENDMDDEYFGINFPLAYAFWGYVLPIIFLVLGIVLPMCKRGGKHWRILIPLSGVWMLLATVLLAVIL